MEIWLTPCLYNTQQLLRKVLPEEATAGHLRTLSQKGHQALVSRYSTTGLAVSTCRSVGRAVCGELAGDCPGRSM